MKTWDEVQQSPEFQSLRPRERERARREYFLDVIAPQVPEDEVSSVRAEFDADTKRSTAANVVRQVGLTARAGVTGALALPAAAGNLINTGVNYGIRGINAVSGAQIPELPMASDALERTVTRVGLPEPENTTERIVYDVNRGMAGVATPFVAASLSAPTTQTGARLRDIFTAMPGAQIAAGASAGGGGGAARELGGGPWEQMGASFLAGLAPGVAMDAFPTIARLALRGSSRNVPQMRANMNAAEEAGTTLSAGQASGTRLSQAVESTLGKFPGSAGPMANKGKTQQAEIGARIEQIANQTAPRADAASAGRSIETSIKGEGGFIKQFKAKQRALYDRLDEFIPADSTIDVSRTQSALAALNAKIPSAENLSQFFINAKMLGVEGALKKDMAAAAQKAPLTPSQIKQASQGASNIDEFNAALPGTTMPYEAIKKLRTLVGDEMANSGLVSDVPRDKWRALYAALSEDLGTAAKASGKSAEQAWKRANNYTRSGMDRLERLDPVLNKLDQENIVQTAIGGTKEGATRLMAVMRSIPKEARNQVTSYVIKKMGTATPGKQDETGAAFSSETFLTNWNKLHPDAKRQLFVDDATRKAMDSVALTAARIREGSKVFANPSGTAPALTAGAGGGGIVMSVLLGQPQIAAGIVGGMGMANFTARAMTNPNFVKWLAKANRAPVTALPGALNALVQQATDDQEAEDYREFARAVGSALQQ